MSKRVLLLSASAGAGHVRAAEALAKDFATHPAVASVEHWDMLKYTSAVFRHIYSKVYLDLVNKAPGVLGWVYERTDTPWGNKGTQWMEKFNSGPFIKAAKAYQPDLIVCTHFTPANVLGWLYSKKQIAVKPAVVVTDLDCHGMWLVKHVERYFVALQETKVYMEHFGIEADRISVTGIPVDPIFRTPRDKPATRKTLGLDPARFTILVSAGGFGVGPMEGLIAELLKLKTPSQVVAIAGKSEDLKKKLEKLAAKNTTGPVKIHPIGFTKQMDEYMAAADILISKPGGLTTSEAMARGLPMCVANPIPGQEERNADHLLEAGAAIRCNNLPSLGWKLQNLLDTPGKLDAMRTAAKNFGRPNAGKEIVSTLLGN